MSYKVSNHAAAPEGAPGTPAIRMGSRRFGRVNWMGLYTLCAREIQRFMSVWTQTLLAPLVTAGLFMVIFSIAIGPRRGEVMGVDFTTFIAPGILMMTVIQNAFANTSSSIVIGKVQGNIVDTLMPPLRPAELVIGYLAGAVGRGVFVALAIRAGLVVFRGIVPQHPLWALTVVVLGSALVGGLMVFLAMNFIGFAQTLGIGSGLMATVVTTMPMWLALWTRWGGERVPLTSWIGLGLGVVGALLLAMEGDFSATWVGALLAFAAPLCWSLGSYASRKLSLPAPAMAAAAQWFVGGAMGLVVALCVEPVPALSQISAKSWAAWLYLLVFGTMVALNAYLWLLQNTTAALAGSYSFVNPAVALLVGVALGGELLTGWVFAALPLIAGALGCILYGPMVLGWWQRRVLPRLRAIWAPTGCQEQG